MVNFNSKPPRAQSIESNAQAQVEEIQQLRDKLFHAGEQQRELEKHVAVNLKAEIQRQLRDNEKLTEKNKALTEDVKRLNEQINRILTRPQALSDIDKREEAEFFRERRIQELEREIQAREARESELSEQQFRQEERILDLKFQKETFDLQYARLQKRITDLEQYKLASSKYSSVLKSHQDAEQAALSETAGQTASALLGITNPSLKKDAGASDSVKLKSKPTKSVAELEMLVESLKRVIEKQKTEAEAIKKQLEMAEARQEKLKSEKQLRQRIESLEQELHSYEMKDVNVGEKDRTIKKLIEANKQLKNDLEMEMERFTLLETNHKNLLVKFNMLAKENAKYAELLFTNTTGAKMTNFDKYLSTGELEQETKTADGFARKFEDLY